MMMMTMTMIRNSVSGDRSPRTYNERDGEIQYIQKIQGKILINDLPKITLLGTCHILRKALSIK